MLYEQFLNVVDEKQDIFCGVSDALWDNPELPFEEYEACRLMTEALEKEGFQVTYNVAGIPTAFKATYGSGSPALGILAEYDGLPSMSQEACVAERRPIPGKDFEYMFYLDFDASLYADGLLETLDLFDAEYDGGTFLGSYSEV